ncbi:MORN-repeat protein [Orpheovirus IHUMI-LCC2]|uniref:MORN-repeat protein n=1 Tax=Orpheovirus IHUMI-LCC2 TaxID=2023057 RepID=A0A2I2L5D2_9VIRU|nr:MORN-repeat protein [Orpheovirus IHUMI-LCC2]SNW62743.1 MORN-repeat protein [Orpheovirus IHUMI-LCC2]
MLLNNMDYIPNEILDIICFDNLETYISFSRVCKKFYEVSKLHDNILDKFFTKREVCNHKGDRIQWYTLYKCCNIKIRHGDYTATYTKYNVNDNITIKCSYYRGKLHGDYTKFNCNHDILEIGNYINGKRHGVYKVWWNNYDEVPNILHTEYNYLNGILHGSYKRYNCGGNIWMLCEYINGKREGEYKECYDINLWKNDLPLKVTCQYKNGKLNGTYQVYDNEGRLYIESYYVNDQRIRYEKECWYYRKYNP